MTEAYNQYNPEHINNIAYSHFPYDQFYISTNDNIISNNSSYNKKGYFFKEQHLRDNVTKFKEYDIVYIPGFSAIASCDKDKPPCFNINGFGVVTHVDEDEKIQVFFGINKGKYIIYLFNPYYGQLEKWLRPTNLDRTFLLSRSLDHSDGTNGDKFAEMIINNTSEQIIPSRSILNLPDNIDDKLPSLNQSNDGSIDNPDEMAKIFNKEIKEQNGIWRDVESGSDTDTEKGGKKKLRKSKKNRKYKNKTIKGGKKNKRYRKQKGGDLNIKEINYHISNLIEEENKNNPDNHINELDTTDNDNKKYNLDISNKHPDFNIIQGYKSNNGSIVWIANMKKDINKYYIIQGDKSEELIDLNKI